MRRVLIPLVAVLPLGSLVACGSTPPGDFSAVGTFATALSAGTVRALPAAQVPAATKAYAAIVKAVGSKPAVTISDMDSSAAKLHWAWKVPGGTWAYDTDVALAKTAGPESDVYIPQWSTQAVVPGMQAGDQVVVTHPRGTRAAILAANGKPIPRGSIDALVGEINHRKDTTLGGVPGTTITLKHAGVATTLLSYAPTNGSPIKLTIKPSWQKIAEGVLDQSGPAAAMIVLRPSTGAIVVAAGNAAGGNQMLATFAHSPSGSTFKTIDSLALIRARKFTAESIVTCPVNFTVMGFKYKNDKWYPPSANGNVPLKTAIAQSCNTAMVSQHAHVTYADLKGAANSLGFGIDHDLGFPALLGEFPKPDNEFAKSQDMIGQGQIQAAPLTMATVIASIQKGATVVPWMIEGTRPAVPAGVKPITKHEDAELKKIFREVVVSGTAIGLSGLPGNPIIAKTGTAEFVRQGLTEPTHTWLIAAQGDLAICVYVDTGVTGAQTSLPLVRQFLQAVGPQ